MKWFYKARIIFAVIGFIKYLIKKFWPSKANKTKQGENKMGLGKYLDKDAAMVTLEKVAEDVVNGVLKPALDKVVADSSNPYDDAALNIAWPMILKALDKIDGEEG